MATGLDSSEHRASGSRLSTGAADPAAQLAAASRLAQKSQRFLCKRVNVVLGLINLAQFSRDTAPQYTRILGNEKKNTSHSVIQQ